MSAPAHTLTRRRLLVAALALILTWGSAFTMVGVAVKHMTPLWIVAYRLVIGAVIVTAYMVWQGYRFPPLRDKRWLWYSCMGMTGAALPFLFLALGQSKIHSGLTAIIAGAMPLMTVLLAHFFTDEKLNTFKLIGFFIGFLGLCVLFIPEDFTLELVEDWRAQLFVLLGAFGYAVTTIIAKRATETRASTGAAMMLICGAVAGCVMAGMEGLPAEPPPLIAYVMVTGLGLGSSGLATIVYLYLVEQSGPTLLARINYFTPVAAVIFGVVLLKEPLTLQMIAAFAVIVSGVAVSRIRS